MTVQEKRTYLGEYQELQKHIVGLTHELEKWNTLGCKVNNAMGNGGSGSNVKSSKVEVSAVNMADIIQDIQKDINDAVEKREAIKKAIRASKKLRHREVLQMHFVNGMSISAIASEYKKEDKTIANAITAALKELEI